MAKKSMGQKAINTTRTKVKARVNAAKRKAYNNSNVSNLMDNKTSIPKPKRSNIAKSIKQYKSKPKSIPAKATSGMKPKVSSLKNTMKNPTMRNTMKKAQTSYTPEMKSLANKIMKNFKKKGPNV
jgi:hypothetical protein